MKSIVLIGGGDFAKKVIKLLKKLNVYDILGYSDIHDQGLLFGKVKYLGNDNELLKLLDGTKNLEFVFCVAGNLTAFKKKKSLIYEFKSRGAIFPRLISPDSSVDDEVKLGEGVIIFDNSFVDFGVEIKSFGVVNIGALVCHDAVIGENTVVSPGAVVSGGANISDNCFVGSNATINPYLTIGDNIVIGAGSVVTKCLRESGVYVGNPVKKIN